MLICPAPFGFTSLRRNYATASGFIGQQSRRSLGCLE